MNTKYCKVSEIIVYNAIHGITYFYSISNISTEAPGRTSVLRPKDRFWREMVVDLLGSCGSRARASPDRDVATVPWQFY